MRPHRITQRTYQAVPCCCPAALLTHLHYSRTDDGGIGVHQRPRAAELEGKPHLHHLPALRLRAGLVLPHQPWLQAEGQQLHQGEHLLKRCALINPGGSAVLAEVLVSGYLRQFIVALDGPVKRVSGKKPRLERQIGHTLD